MVAADLIIGASGNMVLEAALLNKPVIAIYRVAWLTWLAAKLLLRLPWITLPNILLRQGVVPEFVQFFEPGDVGYKALQLLKDERARNAMLQEFQALRVLLEPHGAARRAATEMVAGVYETTSGPADRVNGS
jgi:lipid-A-disaccharide synthase